MSKIERRAIDKVFILLGTAMAAVLLIIGGLSWYGYHFASSMVTSELSSQKIFFPTTDSPAFKALPAADQAAIRPYAGQQLVDGAQAKAYADNFIAVHLGEIAHGQTYAEVSAAALANPTNQALQGQRSTLFQGETLRGMLLGDGYAYWVFSMIAKYAALTAFAGAAVMAVLVLLGLRHVSQQK